MNAVADHPAEDCVRVDGSGVGFSFGLGALSSELEAQEKEEPARDDESNDERDSHARTSTSCRHAVAAQRHERARSFQREANRSIVAPNAVSSVRRALSSQARASEVQTLARMSIRMRGEVDMMRVSKKRELGYYIIRRHC